MKNKTKLEDGVEVGPVRPKCARACSLMLEEITASVSHPTAGLLGVTPRGRPQTLEIPLQTGARLIKMSGGEKGDRYVCVSQTGSRPTAVKEELRVPPGGLRPEPVGDQARTAVLLRRLPGRPQAPARPLPARPAGPEACG